MFNIERLGENHLIMLAQEPRNAHVKGWFETGVAQQWAKHPTAWAIYVDGVLVAAYGFTEYWTGRAHLWMLFSDNAKGRFIGLFKAMKSLLTSQPYRRVEMDVPLDDEAVVEMAHRRAKLLGFRLECERALQYRPNGRDAALYAWTRGAE